MADPQDSWIIPGAYGVLLLDVVARWGINEQTLLGEFGLTREALANPSGKMSVKVANELLRYAHHLTGEPSLAYHLGTQMRISTHGFIGFAIMTADTARDALLLASRFITIRISYGRLTLLEGPDESLILFECDLKLEPLRTEIILALCIGILFMGEVLTGERMNAKISFDFPEPPGFHRFRQLLHFDLEFDQPVMQSRFDTRLLDLKLVSADPVASQLAMAQCEAELSALGEHTRLAAKVRDVLISAKDGYPAMELIADSLHMSDRTLKRQLAAEGTSYTEILEEVRHRKAITLLSRTDLTLEKISEQLDYSDVANFTRAFKRWTGQTPGRWRRAPKFSGR